MQPGKERLTEITSVIKETKKHKPEESSWVANIFGQIFHEQGIKYFKTAAKAFEVNESCTGCGKCVRICPRANIFLKNGCPTFSNNCEFCHACIQWCPKFAITHPDFNPLLNQYKHPSIKYSDIIINI
jgi:ferredoxin